MANEFTKPKNMITYSVKKFDKVVFAMSVIIPWTLLFSVITFYLHASFVLGRYPTFSNPDPKDLKLYSFYGTIINPLLFVWGWTFFIWLIALIIFLQNNSWKDHIRKLIFAIVGHILCIILFFSSIMDWYLDWMPRAANMGLPQAGHDKLSSAFYRYQSSAMGLTVY